MKLNSNNAAFKKLLEYEKRSAHFSPGTGSAGGPSEEWSGVTFSVGESRMACNINHIGEILPCPQATQVPGAKRWIIGLANVRGELLTVVDLCGFLTGTLSAITPRSRLLTTSLNKAPIGLLIDEVFGQRHFLDSDAVAAEFEEDSPLKGFISKQHRIGSETWQELNIEHLFNSAEFLNGAAE